MSSDAHEEVVWFDVPVYEVLVVNVFDSTNHLRERKDEVSSDTGS